MLERVEELKRGRDGHGSASTVAALARLSPRVMPEVRVTGRIRGGGDIHQPQGKGSFRSAVEIPWGCP